MPPKTQVNSATGIMGVTGSGKSSLAATLAKYLWRKYQKILRYYACDGGGYPAEVQACIAIGIIEVFRMYTRDPGDLGLSFETCQRACQGWWPKRINPATGDVEPGVEMVPPIALRFEMHCPEGHLVKVVPSEALLQPTICPQCKKPVTKQDMRVRKTMVQNKGFEKVGGTFFDGLSSMLAWELREMGHRAGRLELKGEEASIGGKVVSGELKFGGSTRSHVGFVQARGEELVHLTLGIPNLLVPPVFTMLTHEDVDERSLSIIGPKISGRAKTDEAPQWFGNMLETAKIPAQQGSGEQRILYLSEFTDQRGVRHLCKHRGSPGTMPAFLIDPPEGETDPAHAFVQFNLGVFFDMLNAALERRISDVALEFPDAPGLPEGIVQVGDMTQAPAPPVTQAAVSVAVTGVAAAAVAGPVSVAAPPAPPAPARGRKRATAPGAPPAAVPLQAAPPAPAPAPAQAAAPPAPTVQAPAQQAPAPQAPAGAAPAAPVTPRPPTPGAPAAPGAPVRVGVAPPAGQRPQARAAAPGAPQPRPNGPNGQQGHPAPVAAPAPARPVGAPTLAAAPRPGTPAGATVSGPMAPRAAAPRPPAAAPRPPAPRPAAPPAGGETPH